MKNKLWRKVFSVLLSAAMVAGTGFICGDTQAGFNTSVSAAVYNDFVYFTDSTYGIVISGYVGSENHITIPDKINGRNVGMINKNAFENRTDIISIYISSNVILIHESAFKDCTNLEEVTFGKNGSRLWQICESAFENCTKLGSIDIPAASDSLAIQQYAFKNCTSLANVTIANRDSDDCGIYPFAFENCTSLTAIHLPDKIYSAMEPSISSAFTGCTNLESIEVSENNNYYYSENGVLYTKDKTKLVLYPGGKKDTAYTMPSSVTGVTRQYYKDDFWRHYTSREEYYYDTDRLDSETPSMAFRDANYLEAIYVEDGNTSFSSQDGILFSKDGSKLLVYPRNKAGTSYTVPYSVYSVDRHAFDSQKNLTDIVVSRSTHRVDIGLRAFANCPNLSSVILPTTMRMEDIYSSGVVILCHEARPFQNCPNLTDVYFEGSEAAWNNRSTPENTPDQTTVHYNCKYNEGICGDNAYFTFNDGTMTIYGSGAIYSFNYDEISSNCPSPFYNDTRIQRLVIEEGITKTGQWTFRQCKELRNLFLPQSITLVFDTAFQDCGKMNDIYYPGTRDEFFNAYSRYGAMVDIWYLNTNRVHFNSSIAESGQCGDHAYYTLDNNGKLIISGLGALSQSFSIAPVVPQRNVLKKAMAKANTVQTAGLSDNSAIQNVVIYDGITSLMDSSFSNLPLLTKVSLPDTLQTIGQDSFGSNSDDLTIYANTGTCGEQYAQNNSLELSTTLVFTDTVPATCTTAGKQAYYYDSYNDVYYDEDFTQQIQFTNNIPSINEWGIIAATGHDWETTYTWSDDNSTVTATRICQNDNGHMETETVDTSYQVVQAAGCESNGTGRFTANFQNTAFTSQTKDIVLDAINHDWNEPTYTWSDDNTTVTATRTCKNDVSHIETETVNTSYQVTRAASCTTSGTGKFTANFANTAFTSQTKNTVIPATGHYYLYDEDVPATEDGHTMKCAVCGKTIVQEHTFDDDHICTVCGYEQPQPIDWSKVTFEFDNGNGVYAYIGRTIEPDFTLYYDGEEMTLDVDYCFAEDSDDSSKRAGKHTIIICDINDEENTFSFDYYIYNLGLTAAEDTSADNKVKFVATRNADKNNITRFGMVLDRSGAFGENVSLDSNTNIFNTTNTSTNKYIVTAADRGCGVWAMAYMQISLNGKSYMVYSQIKHETRYTPEQIASPTIQGIVPQIINNKVFVKISKPAYDMNLYICKEMGILFSKNGTISSLESAQTNDTLIYANVGKGVVSKGYIDAKKVGESSIDGYSAYSANISFVNNNPVYTRAYVIFTNKNTNEDLIIYGDYFVTNPNS